jgi:hypothetical protein
MNTNPEIVNSVEDNASDYLQKVNTLLAQHNVKDKDGNPASLRALAGSPTWLMALAQGQITSEWQEKVRKANYAIDIENCSDEQVYALAVLAGVLFKEQSAPFISLSITNPSSSDNLVLTPSNCYAEDSFASNKWYVDSTYTIAPEETVSLTFYCSNKKGSVPSNISFTLQSTEEPEAFDPIAITSDSKSIILFEGETTSELRNRMLQKSASRDPISQAEIAIANLNGIVKCSIFFNDNAVNPKALRGVTVPPRTAFVSIRGVDTDNLLATTYFRYLNIKTMQREDSSSSEVMVGSELIPVYYTPAVEVQPYIRVKMHPFDSVIDTYQDYIKDLLMTHKYDLNIGESLTAQRVCTWINEGNKYGVIETVQLYSDDDVHLRSYVNVDAYAVLTLNKTRISFEEVAHV